MARIRATRNCVNTKICPQVVDQLPALWKYQCEAFPLHRRQHFFFLQNASGMPQWKHGQPIAPRVLAEVPTITSFIFFFTVVSVDGERFAFGHELARVGEHFM